jgi:hypothetical protein
MWMESPFVLITSYFSLFPTFSFYLNTDSSHLSFIENTLFVVVVLLSLSTLS